jgi:hypothetical protein
MSKSTGFIILRHVQNRDHNKLWTNAYDHVRRHYNDHPIVIIDDSSSKEFLEQKEMHNTIVIESELPKRAEFLPYYYFLHNKWFDDAVIIHDSVFINSKIDLGIDDYKMLWTFKHIYNKPYEEKRILSKMRNSQKLIDLYDNQSLWSGCFGAMSIINHEYLKLINETFDLSTLIPHIQTRSERMCFERVIACLLHSFRKNESLFGDIHNYGPWDVRYDEAIKHTYLPVIKAWSIRS